MSPALRSLTGALIVAVAGGGRLAQAQTPGPEDRAIAYLAREVPRWSHENQCFSCHNNGDAARALYEAVGSRRNVAPEALADTTGWLVHPERWDLNGGQGPFNDKRLARVEFAAASAAAVTSGQVRDRAPLDRAARRLAEDQDPDGSWPIADGQALGSPATYGRALVTLSARETLHVADPARYRDAVERADRWLLKQPVVNVPDTSAILAASTLADSPEAAAKRRGCLDLLRKGQSDDGGWGPYTDAPPEIFDTAAALLALARLNDPDAELIAMKDRARSFLIAHQNADGGWTETTRPSGGDSYAQRLSTTGWATRALLATTARDKARQKTGKGPRAIHRE